MILYRVIDTSTGKIIRSGSCDSPSFLSQAKSGQEVKEGTADDATQYELAGVLTARPVMPATFDETIVTVGETITISNIPVGTTVKYNTIEETIDDPMDTSLSWSSLAACKCMFSFENFPYQEKRVLVEVIE